MVWPFRKLFGGRPAEGFAAEAEQVLAQREEIVNLRDSLYPQNKDDPQQHLKWYRDRLPVLQNERYHPVAKLSFSKRYDEMVVDFVNKLKQAEAGDKAAIAEVAEIKAKAPKLIDDELEYLKFKLGKWENIQQRAQEVAHKEDVDWAQKKAKLEAELAQEREKLDAAFPKNKEDMTQWKSYYQQRVARLELPKDVLSPVAKMVWVTSMTKEEVEKRIKTYLELLDRLIAGEQLEEQLRTIENYIEIVVINEGIRLHRTYPQFLQKSGQIPHVA